MTLVQLEGSANYGESLDPTGVLSTGCGDLCTYLIIGLINTEQCLFAVLFLFRLREQADYRISSHPPKSVA